MYNVLGICLALAALLIVNALASLLTAAFWRVVSRLTKGLSSATRARLIFICRTFPATTALLVVIFFFIPSYLVFEPNQTGETVSIKLALLALFSAVGIALAVRRGIAAWLVTKRLVNDWQNHSEIVLLENSPIPAYRINHQFPVVAVIGVFRPKLFVAEQIFNTLNNAELAAVIEHETAHLTARDNLKHWLMRICRDVLAFIPFNHLLDKEWKEAIELAADEKAASSRNGAFALDLAQALIKIARLVPAGSKPTMPAGAFLIESESESGDALARRIQRLAQFAESNFNVEKGGRERFSGGFLWICFILLFVAGTLAATNFDLLAATHAGIERIVAFLS